MCCSDRTVETLQNLDVINLKDPVLKAQFYRSTLKEALPFLPRVSTNNFCSQTLSASNR